MQAVRLIQNFDPWNCKLATTDILIRWTQRLDTSCDIEIKYLQERRPTGFEAHVDCACGKS
jgi:hypothetical protein